MPQGQLTQADRTSAASHVHTRVPNELIDLLAKSFGPDEAREDCGQDGDDFRPRYVPITVVLRRLNDVLGPNGWSHQLVSWQLAPGGREVITHVRLGVNVHGQGWQWQSSYDGVGQAFLKQRTDQNGAGYYWDFSKDLKAAVSDGICKAAKLIGIGLHLYEKDESSFQGLPKQPSSSQIPVPDASHPDAPAHPMKIQHVQKIFDKFGVGDRWASDLQLSSPSDMTDMMATAIMSQQHPYVKWLIQQSGGNSHTVERKDT